MVLALAVAVLLVAAGGVAGQPGATICHFPVRSGPQAGTCAVSKGDAYCKSMSLAYRRGARRRQTASTLMSCWSGHGSWGQQERQQE